MTKRKVPRNKASQDEYPKDSYLALLWNVMYDGLLKLQITRTVESMTCVHEIALLLVETIYKKFKTHLPIPSVDTVSGWTSQVKRWKSIRPRSYLL